MFAYSEVPFRNANRNSENVHIQEEKEERLEKSGTGKIKRPAKNIFTLLLEVSVLMRIPRPKHKSTSQRQSELLPVRFSS